MIHAVFGSTLPLGVDCLNPTPGLQSSFIIFRMAGRWHGRAGQWFSDLSRRQHHLEGLLNFTREDLSLGRAQESASLTHSREILVLLVPRAHLEDHWARPRRKLPISIASVSEFLLIRFCATSRALLPRHVNKPG